MLDCFSTLTHGFWIWIKALLHSVEQMLMLPPGNPPLWRCTTRVTAVAAFRRRPRDRRRKFIQTPVCNPLGA
jgi:hypothetical protein